MKKLFRALVVLAVLSLAALAALYFWVGPKVEDMTRRELAELPQAVAALPTPLRLAAPQVREIEFSPFSRRLTVRGLEIRGTGNSLPLVRPKAGRKPAPGEVRYTLEEGSYRLPLRALLLFTPLRNLALPEKGMITIGEDLRLSNFATVATQSSGTMQSLIKSETASHIRMDSALVRQLLEERESSAALPQGILSGQVQAERAAPDLLHVAYRMGIGELRASGVSTRLLIPEENINVHFSCEAVRMRNWEGPRVQEAVMDRLSLKQEGEEFLSLGVIREKEITLPEEAVLRDLLAQASEPLADPDALQAALLRLIRDKEPLFKELDLADLRVPVKGESSPAVTLRKASMHWASNTPSQSSYSVDALSLPTSLLERESGLTFPGLPALVLDATLAFEGRDASSAREHGTLRAQSLGALEYDFLLWINSSAQSSPQTVLDVTFGDVRLKYADQGLTAYLVKNVLPSAREATSILKAAIAAFCSGPAPENPAIRKALDTFATRPGVLEAQSKPGKKFNLLELVSLLGGDPGALFTVTAQPGTESLEAQINRLNAAAAFSAK